MEIDTSTNITIVDLPSEILVGVFNFIQSIKDLIILVKCCSCFRSVLYYHHNGIVLLDGIRVSEFMKSSFKELRIKKVILDVIDDSVVKRVRSCVITHSSILEEIVSIDHRNINVDTISFINNKYDMTFSKSLKKVAIRKVSLDLAEDCTPDISKIFSQLRYSSTSNI